MVIVASKAFFGNDTVGLHSWRGCKCNVVLIKTPHNDTKVNVKLSNVYCLALLPRNHEIMEYTSNLHYLVLPPPRNESPNPDYILGFGV